ncbi:MAG: chemotaxis protein CheX [candidate division Zixibacteria bacterium]|nr:chemotaxis protein CheX [candidate division Zixibacteria bacterium]
MMNNQISSEFMPKISEVVCEILQSTAFIFPEPADLSDGIAFDENEFLLAHLTFNGYREGEVSFITTTGLLVELAANLLGEDEENSISEEKYSDAAKEILNIISGQILTTLFGEREVFNLTPPEVRTIKGEELFSILEESPYCFSIADDNPIITTFALKEGAYEH